MTKIFSRCLIFILFAGSLAQSTPAFSQVLELRDFMNQVESENDAFVTAHKREKAFELRGDEYKLYARPTLIGGAETMKDERLTQNPKFMGYQTNAKTYSLGVQQTTNFGLDAKLTYKYMDTSIVGADPTFLPQPNFIIASPVLELNQSLWRNWFGRQVTAKQEGDAALVRANRLNEEYTQIAMRAQAESAYWRLVLARKMVTAVRGNMERADRIYSWYSKRSEMQLSDQSDALQGKAIVATRKIELQSALDEERSASRNFNLMRGSDQEDVKEKLQELKYEQIEQLTIPEKVGQRKDLQAAEQQAKADSAQAKAMTEANKPDVTAYAQLSLNGRDPSGRTSMDQSFSSNYPMTVVGVKLNVPLSLGIASDTRQGYRILAEASNTTYQRKSYEIERNYIDLSRRFEDSKRRLALAIQLEDAQRGKVEFEKKRRGRGRSTTYQVIQFEQDYATAQVSRINLEAEILNLHAQLKTFGGRQ